ncbi:hypothetical protein X943_001915 [Babesia divergens]|uniref:RING-type domain-containing protein n=1 Tax=Babesia divergens TaxID=32595 RepID=A0AAD9LH13_BABDI|nr:hypothetical protein X943_001915 [Babesia divergens]
MGSLITDAILLEKRQKVVFSQLYNQISSIVTLVEETVSSLTGKSSVGPLPSEQTCSSGNTALEIDMKPNECHGAKQIKGTTTENPEALSPSSHHVQHYTSEDSTESLKTMLTDLASSVKSLDVQKCSSRSYRDVKSRYNKLGRTLFKSGYREGIDLLSHMGFDEQLVLRMIGTHVLHYGHFDVYNTMKSEAIGRWGDDCRALVSENVIRAYRILHGMISQFRQNDIEPLIDWVNAHRNKSHLHVERFNAVLINLHRIQLFNDYYHMVDGVLQIKELDITPDHVYRVKNSVLSEIRSLHKDEIGKLMAQALLGTDLPDPSEFIEMKRTTEKMFFKLFCEDGVLVRKSSSSSSRSSTRQPNTLHYRHRTVTKDEPMEEDIDNIAAGAFSTNDITASMKFVHRSPLRSTPKEASIRESWLSRLNRCRIENNTCGSGSLSPYSAKRLTLGWLLKMEGAAPPPPCRFPKINFPRLRSPALSQNANIRSVKRIILGGSVVEKCLYSTETICFMGNDVEVRCRKLIPRLPYPTITDYSPPRREDGMGNADNLREDEDLFRGDFSRGVAAVLIAAAANNPHLRYITVPNTTRGSIPSGSQYLRRVQYVDPPATRGGTDPRRGVQPTMSLTLFTASQTIRDSILASQTNENDPSQRVVTTDDGRIRITFPQRSEGSDTALSQGRRSGGRGARIHPYEAGNEADLSSSIIDRTVLGVPDLDEDLGSGDTANINVRGILRMIMRGLTGGISSNTDTVLPISGDTGTAIPSSGVRQHDQPQPHAAPGLSKVTPTQPYKEGFKTAYERDEGDFVRVFLPYESPISVLVCAGYLIHPRLLEIVDIPRKNEHVSSKIGSWIKSCKQLPIDSDLGPAFCFHSYLTCPISKDQTSSKNLPVMLPCGHVICTLCVDSFGNSRRKQQFKCPMCPQLISLTEMKELYLDWNSCGFDEPS